MKLGIATLFLLTATAHAAPVACGYVEARDAFASVSERARWRLRDGDPPPVLQKDKVGLVLVARPAPPPTDKAALREDIARLRRLLDRAEPTLCDEALRVRRRYAL